MVASIRESIKSRAIALYNRNYKIPTWKLQCQDSTPDQSEQSGHYGKQGLYRHVCIISRSFIIPTSDLSSEKVEFLLSRLGEPAVSFCYFLSRLTNTYALFNATAKWISLDYYHSSAKISFSAYPIAPIAIFALSKTLPFTFGSLTSKPANAPWVEVKEYGFRDFQMLIMSFGGSGIWRYYITK